MSSRRRVKKLSMAATEEHIVGDYATLPLQGLFVVPGVEAEAEADTEAGNLSAMTKIMSE